MKIFGVDVNGSFLHYTCAKGWIYGTAVAQEVERVSLGKILNKLFPKAVPSVFE